MKKFVRCIKKHSEQKKSPLKKNRSSEWKAGKEQKVTKVIRNVLKAARQETVVSLRFRQPYLLTQVKGRKN